MKLPVEIRVLRLFASTGKGGEEGDPVRLSLRSGSGEFLQGWHYVPEGEHVVGRTTGLDHLGPHSDERCPHTSLVEGTLEAAVGTIAVEEVGVMPSLLVRTIVGGEDEEGILRQSLLLKYLHHPPYIVVDPTNHTGIGCLGLRFGAVPIALEGALTELSLKGLPILLLSVQVRMR